MPHLLCMCIFFKQQNKTETLNLSSWSKKNNRNREIIKKMCRRENMKASRVVKKANKKQIRQISLGDNVHAGKDRCIIGRSAPSWCLLRRTWISSQMKRKTTTPSIIPLEQKKTTEWHTAHGDVCSSVSSTIPHSLSIMVYCSVAITDTILREIQHILHTVAFWMDKITSQKGFDLQSLLWGKTCDWLWCYGVWNNTLISFMQIQILPDPMKIGLLVKNR